MNEYKYETHMHTSEVSMCAKISAIDQVRIYKKKGYAGIIITDHIKSFNFRVGRFLRQKAMLSWKDKVEFIRRGYEEAKKEGDKIGLDVFFGWEFDFRGSDFLTYGLDTDFLLKHKYIEDMPIEAYSALVRKSGGFIAQAHPYRKQIGGERQVPIMPDLLDAVEVYNGKNTRDLNEKAEAFAAHHYLPMQAGTDSHRPDLKFYSGIILDKKAETIFDIITAIKSKKARLIVPSENEIYNDAEDSVLVKIFYDSKSAKEVAEELRRYLQKHLEIDALCAGIEEEGKIDRTAHFNKTIILGHHPDTKKRLEYIKEHRHEDRGMKYAYDANLCVLTVSRTEMRNSNEAWNRFVTDYQTRFHEIPDNENKRAAQFRFLVDEFILSGLDEFVKH